jgi:phosphoserine aminotransferase
MSSEEASNDQETSAETPELSEEGKEKVRQMQEAYNDDRPTAVLPGTNNTITGVAVNEWLDDEGNPKFGKDEQQQDQNDDQQQQSQSHKDTEDA